MEPLNVYELVDRLSHNGTASVTFIPDGNSGYDIVVLPPEWVKLAGRFHAEGKTANEFWLDRIEAEGSL